MHCKKCTRKDVHKQVDRYSCEYSYVIIRRKIADAEHLHAVTKIRLERFEFNESVKRVTN